MSARCVPLFHVSTSVACMVPCRREKGSVCLVVPVVYCCVTCTTYAPYMQALSEAMAMCPAHPDTLTLQAHLCTQQGNHQAAFTALQNLSRLQPNRPGLAAAMQRVARMAVQQQDQRAAEAAAAAARAKADNSNADMHGSTGGGGGGYHGASGGGCGYRGVPGVVAVGGTFFKDPHFVLGVEVSASEGEVRRAYRQLAARWHPDKWRAWSCSDGEREVAAAKFLEVQQAYDAITGPR